MGWFSGNCGFGEGMDSYRLRLRDRRLDWVRLAGNANFRIMGGLERDLERNPAWTAALLAGACLLAVCACSLARDEVEKEVLASLRERIRAAGAGISVDSIRLGKPEGADYPGRIFLRSGEVRESDSIRVKSGLSGLEYEFPVPGPLLARIFGGS
jgi:hypothetical protein